MYEGRLKLRLLCAVATTLFIFQLFIIDRKTNQYKPLQGSGFQPETKMGKSKIVIGAVSCRDLSNSTTDYTNYTLTMLKSVIISAQRDNISELDIHLFLEHVEPDAERFRRELLVENNFKGHSPLEVKIFTYSAVDLVPVKYQKHMVYHSRFRCGYVRFYFPGALPAVDAIIYLDSDILVTGSILKLWQEFDRMNDAQLVGMGFNRNLQNKLYPIRDQAYKRFPHVGLGGLNNGLLIMNLTRMRQFEWEEKVTQIYRDYSKLTKVTGQAIANILMYYNPLLYQLIPCNLHFIYYACELQWFCKEADADPEGIHLIHGLSFTFHETQIWSAIYKLYQLFNVSSPTADFRQDIVAPALWHYSQPHDTNLCYGTVNRTLFKDYV